MTPPLLAPLPLHRYFARLLTAPFPLNFRPAPLRFLLLSPSAHMLCLGVSSLTNHSYESSVIISKFYDYLHSEINWLLIFYKLLHPTRCLHHFLPPKRHNPQMSRLWLMIYHLPEQISLKIHFSFMHYIITFNVSPICPVYSLSSICVLIFYCIYIFVFVQVGCQMPTRSRYILYAYFNSFLLYLIVCISSCNLLWLQDIIDGCILGA